MEKAWNLVSEKKWESCLRYLKLNKYVISLFLDCLECMACSDNVVRAGLTPKYIDVSTLCSMLNYSCKPADDNKFSCKPHPSDPCVTVYNPPVPDFAVDEIKVCFLHMYFGHLLAVH